jgi:hypothetical protein
MLKYIFFRGCKCKSQHSSVREISNCCEVETNASACSWFTIQINWLRRIKEIRGSFQKFCTLYVSSLKMDLFYKIHLHVFNVISIVLYHSGPTFGQVLCSCLDAFVVDASDYSGHLDRHLLNASEAFPTEWFLRNKSKSCRLSPPEFDLFPKLKKPLRGKRFRSI